MLDGGALVDGDPVEEIPRERYAQVVQILLDAGASVPEAISERGVRPVTLIAELGLEPSG